jgi:lipid-binding SYLF domain-containing protein
MLFSPSLHGAKGLCFLTVLKAGLVVSGCVGTGLLVAQLDNCQSAPCALGTVGMGCSMLAGGNITHYLVVSMTHEAVKALLGGTVQLGAKLGVAVGPVRRIGSSKNSIKRRY